MSAAGPATQVPLPGVVLVVDDSRFVRASMVRGLSHAFAVQQADSGERAWELLLLDPSIRAVLSDLSMPGLDGFELLERVRGSRLARLRELPFAVLSGADEPQQRARADALGADRFVVKGAPIEPLLRWLHERLSADAVARPDGAATAQDAAAYPTEAGPDAPAGEPDGDTADRRAGDGTFDRTAGHGPDPADDRAKARPTDDADGRPDATGARHPAGGPWPPIADAAARPYTAGPDLSAEPTHEPGPASPEPGAVPRPTAAAADATPAPIDAPVPISHATPTPTPARASASLPPAAPVPTATRHPPAPSVPTLAAVPTPAGASATPATITRLVADPLGAWYQASLSRIAGAGDAPPALIRLSAVGVDDLPARLRRGVRAADALHLQDADTAWLCLPASAALALRLGLRFGVLAAGRPAGARVSVCLAPVDPARAQEALAAVAATRVELPLASGLTVEAIGGAWGAAWRCTLPWPAARLLVA